MKIISLKYRKKDNSITDRVIIPLYEPSDKYFGIDLSELDTEDQGLFAAEFEKLDDEFIAKLDQLMQDFDMKYKFRSFLASNVIESVAE